MVSGDRTYVTRPDHRGEPYGVLVNREFNWTGPSGTVVLRSPDQRVIAGVVLLHGAADGRARQPLFDQLTQILTPLGIAVLSYDRRQSDRGGDIPLAVQAADAVDAMRVLSDHLGVPVGFFGFSQGAWAASIAAADPATNFLIVLGCSGVSPAEQMRYYTDELLRRHGYNPSQRNRLANLRVSYEDHLRRKTRGTSAHDRIAELLAAAATEPWFVHAYLPASLPLGSTWPDMDFDPAPSFAKISCPVLAIWGSDEECVPLQRSWDAWRMSGAVVTTAQLPGCGHWPVIGSGDPLGPCATNGQVSEDLDITITQWLSQQLSTDHNALCCWPRRR